MKLILWLALGVFAFWILRALRRSRASPRAPHARPAERMVMCEHCGVNQALSESMLRDGHYYCCEAHAEMKRPH